MTHTPGKLRQSAGDAFTIFCDHKGRAIKMIAKAQCGGLSGVRAVGAEANARRIVACINACAGIPTEALEAGVVADLIRDLTTAARALEKADDTAQIVDHIDATLERAGQ